jgi:hypothetical protein
MKKLILLSLLAFSIQANAKSDEPKLLLEYNYGCTCDTSRVLNMKSDADFCCYFDIEVKANNSSEDICYIRDRETGVLLGTIYGKPTKEFLLHIYQTNLKFLYTDNQIKKLIELQRAEGYTRD